MSERNSFGLVGDGDEMVLIAAIEEAFWIAITDAEAEKILNMGNLHDLIVGKLGAGDQRRDVCLSAATFYRLRRALFACGINQPITPSFDLRPRLMRDNELKRRWKAIGRSAGLKLPELTLSPNGHDLWLTTGIVLVGLAAWMGSLGLVMLAIVTWIASCRVMPGAVPPHVARVGDLSRFVLAYNYGKLSRAHNCAHRDDIWRALATVVRDASGTGYGGVIDRDTVFFSCQLKVPRG